MGVFRLFGWKIYLYWHGYCTRHVVQKEWGGYDPESMYRYCPECEKESDAKHDRRIEAAKLSLGRHKGVTAQDFHGQTGGSDAG
jgi:hypothetical protein